MSFVIYNTDTFRIFKFPHGGSAVFDEERVAKAQRTKLINKGVLNSSWVVDTYDNMVAKEPMVTVKSLMTGTDVQIRKSDVGTCVDPSTERYWTM